MKTSTKLRLAGKGAGGALGATYRTGKLVGGAQHELTGGRRPIVAWAPAVGGLIVGFSIAYFLDRTNGAKRRRALRGKLAGADAPVQGAAPTEDTGSRPSGPQAGTSPPVSDRPNDPTLARMVESEIFRDPSVPKGMITVSAADGVISLRGQVDSTEQAKQLREAAEKVEGVLRVEDFLHLEGEAASNKEPALDR